MSRRETRPALRAVSDRQPGLRRRRRGSGFAYLDSDGAPVRDARTLERIRGLVIPPAWRDVWICPSADGHVQAVGRDALGRKQYRYHPEWNRRRSETKYARLDAFAQELPALRAQVARDLRRPGLPRRKVVALVVRLLERTLIRVGNAEYVALHESYGLTTLKDRHVVVTGSSVKFDFQGKSHVHHELLLRDRGLARLVGKCRELPGQALFQYVDARGRRGAVDSGDVNDYVRAAMGADFTAKDFRTWGGTCLAVACLHDAGAPRTRAASPRAIASAVREVAEALGNRAATCRKHYIHPAVLEAYAAGRLHELASPLLARARASRSDALTPLERATRAVLRMRPRGGASVLPMHGPRRIRVPG